MSINRETWAISWNILKIAIVLWPMLSLPFVLYFGLNGDDPSTAFSKSLIASAVILASIVVISSCIKYLRNILAKAKTD